MLHLQQVLPGAANISISPNNLRYGIFRGLSFIVYATANKAVVLDANINTVPLKVTHVLLQDKDITSLDTCLQNGRVCASLSELILQLGIGLDNQVVIYEPSFPKDSQSTETGKTAVRSCNDILWSRVCVIDNDFAPTSLSWRPSGDYLLVSGSSSSLWKLESNPDYVPNKPNRMLGEPKDPKSLFPVLVSHIWSSKVNSEEISDNNNNPKTDVSSPNPIKYCLFSSDGQYWASVGDYDRFVKLWFRYSQDNFRFIYLPHPRSVVNISWRHRYTESHSTTPKFEPNVLLTVCRGGVVRFWVETSPAERLQFYVASVIDAGQACVIDWLHSASWLKHLNQERLDLTDESAPVPNSSTPIQSVDLLHPGDARTSRHATAAPHSDHQVTQRHQEDWIVGVQQSGTLNIWKVEGLTDQPKRPRDAMSSSSSPKFSSPPTLGVATVKVIGVVSSFAVHLHSDEKDKHFPTRLKIYTLNLSGAISCWDCSVDSPTLSLSHSISLSQHSHGHSKDSATAKASVSLLSTCFGHKGHIQDLVVHPNLSRVASIDKTQRMIIWSINEPKLSNPPFALENTAIIDSVNHFAWTPSPNLVLTSNSRGIFLYAVEANNNTENEKEGSLVTLIGLLSDSDSLNSLMYLHVFSFTDDQEWKVLAIGQSGQEIALWGLHKPRSTERETTAALQLGQLSWVHKMPQDVSITCASVANPTFFGERNQTIHSPFPFNLLTGCSDGSVRLWKIHFQSGKNTGTTSSSTSSVQCEQVGCFKFYDTPVASIKCATFGQLATMAASQKEKQIHIWMFNSVSKSASSFQFILQETLSFGKSDKSKSDFGYEQKDSSASALANQLTKGALPTVSVSASAVSSGRDWLSASASTVTAPTSAQTTVVEEKVHFDWLPQYDGDNVLAVSSGNKLSLFISTSSDDFNAAAAKWQERDIATLDSQNIEAVTWTKDGTLICGVSNQLQVFSKWVTQNEPLRFTLLQESSYSNRSLPFYHPKILAQYMMGGQSTRVGTILKHLLDFITDWQSKTKIPIRYVPPLPLETLIPVAAAEEKTDTKAADKAKQKQKDEDKYSFLDTPAVSFDLDSDLSSITSNFDTLSNNSSPAKKLEYNDFRNAQEVFTPKLAKELSELLTSIALPRVSSTEQMLLMAIIDTFSQIQETHGGLDECGARFLLAHKMFAFLKRSVPPGSRPASLSSADFVWALHSQAEETVLQTCLPPNSTWNTAKSLGIGWWLRNPTLLRTTVDKMAQAQFTEKKDPNDCALFFLALDKKVQLMGLFKAVKNQPLADFLRNDFKEEKWATAALKNAYVLMSKGRFELAAAFFLLGGQLKDCVNIIMQKLEDLQLALLIARVVEGEGGIIYESILTKNVIPYARDAGDNAMMSLAYWLLKKYKDSAIALVPQDSASPTSQSSSPTTSQSLDFGNDNSSSQSTMLNTHAHDQGLDPAALYLFKFIRGHTMLRDVSTELEDVQFNLVLKCARSYARAGYLILAAEQLIPIVQQIAADAQNQSQTQTQAAAAPAPKTFTYGMKLFRPGGIPASTPAPAQPKSQPKTIDKSLLFKLVLKLLTQEIGDYESFLILDPYSVRSPGLRLTPKETITEEKKETTEKSTESSDNNNSNTDKKDSNEQKKTEPTEDDKPLLKKNIQFLLSKFGLTEQKVVMELLLFCENREHLFALGELLWDKDPKNKSRIVQLLISSCRQIADLASSNLADLTLSQANQLAILATELHECTHLVEAEMPNAFTGAQKIDLTATIKFGLFLYAWKSRDYHSLLSLLFKDSVQDIVKRVQTNLATMGSNAQTNVDSSEDLDESFDDDFKVTVSIEWFLQTLLDLLIIRKFHGNLEHMIGGNKTSFRQSVTVALSGGSINPNATGQSSPIISLNANPIAASIPTLVPNIVKSMEAWFASLANQVVLLPSGLSKLKLAGQATQGYIQVSNQAAFRSHLPQLFSTALKRTPLYRSHEDFRLLVQQCFEDEKLVTSFQDIPFMKPKHFVQNAAQDEIKFKDTAIIFHDKDLLQSLCINPVNPLQIAVAGTRGLVELTLNPNSKFDRYDKNSKHIIDETDEPPIEPDSEETPSTPSTPKEPPTEAQTLPPTTDKPNELRSSTSNLTPVIQKFKNQFPLKADSLATFPFRKEKKPTIVETDLLVARHIDYGATVLESHPFKPYYLSGGTDGSVSLWQYTFTTHPYSFASKDKDSTPLGGGTPLVCNYRIAPHARVNRLHFNSSGTKFGACDMSGLVSLWRFDTEVPSKPFQVIQCHTKRTLDMAFVNAGTLFAAVGLSDNKQNICLWDTLLPQARSCVRVFESAQDSGLSSVIYSARHQLLVCGGKKGEIEMFDVRQSKLLESNKAYTQNVKSLTLSPYEDFFISGSSDGTIKAFDLPSLQEKETWEGAHNRQTFVRKPGVGVFNTPVSTYGVMQVLLTEKFLWSCGADGRILRSTMQSPHQQPVDL